MAPQWIAIQGFTFPITDLDKIDTTTLPVNSKKAILFCKDWLNGKQSFSITTSGSTGTPKQIEVRRDSMIASAQRTAKALELKPGMTALVCLDTGFIAGMMMIVRSFATGMNMIITEPSSNPLQQLPAATIDFAALVPYQVHAMLNSDQREQLARIGTIILGGAPVNAGLLEALNKLPSACYATFGMTETLSHVALQRLNGARRQENFHVLDGVKITVDQRGCLVIEADYLSETIVTNDLVEIVSKTEFKWLGRWDNVINSGGIKVIPEKIEKPVATWMRSKGLLNRVFVSGRKDEKLGEQVVLVVEGRFEENDEKDLMAALNASLTKYEVPKRVLYVTRFSETPTGKIDRSASLRPDAMDL